MSFLAALMGAIPVALIAAVCIPMLVFELGIEVLPSLFNPDFYTGYLKVC